MFTPPPSPRASARTISTATGLHFTLIELLVVVAIVGVLASMLLPVLSKARRRATDTACLNNQKQLFLAMNFYGESNDGFVLRPDEGRANGTWTGFNASITNDRPVGQPEAIIYHGAWLQDSSLTTDSYFCPAVSFVLTQGNWPTLDERKARWQTGAAQEFFRTGGLSGGASRNATNITSYVINPLLTGKNITQNPLNGRVRLHEMSAELPILMDYRGSDGNSSRYMHHEGRGYTVLAADGHAEWMTITRLTGAGLRLHTPSMGYKYSPHHTYFQPWIGYNQLPTTLPNAYDESATGTWSRKNDNPYLFNDTALFGAAQMAIQAN